MVDGSGGPGFEADVAVDGDRITIVGEVAGTRTRGARRPRPRARARVHRPAHAPRRQPVLGSRRHAVLVVRRDHGGHRQLRVRARADRRRRRARLRGRRAVHRRADRRGPRSTTACGFTGGTQADYFGVLDQLPVLCNFATLVGHVPVRTAVLGPDAAHERVATADEVARIAELVADGLRLGALGFSTDQVVGNFGPGGGALPGPGVRRRRAARRSPASSARFPGPGSSPWRRARLIQGRAEREADLDWHVRLAEASGKPVVVGPVFDRWSDPGVGYDLVELIAARSRPRRAGRAADLDARVRAVDPPRHARAARARAPHAARRGRRRTAPTVRAASPPTSRRAAQLRDEADHVVPSLDLVRAVGARRGAVVTDPPRSLRSQRPRPRDRMERASRRRAARHRARATTSRRSSRRAWRTTTTTGSRAWSRTRRR